MKRNRSELVEAFDLGHLPDERIIKLAQKEMAADQRLAEAKEVANQRPSSPSPTSAAQGDDPPANQPGAAPSPDADGSVSVPPGANYAHDWHLRNDAIALYAAIEPRDAVESLLARIMVGLGNGVMDCLGRAAESGDWLEPRKVNLGFAVKGGLAVAQIVKALDHHRGQDRQKVTVGQVNVESGGQAIVGNVGRRGRREQVTQLAPIPIAAPRSDDDQPEDDQEE
ncbi:MAG TPA: hypothetical protein DCQ79_01935 [Rhizobiales bacterium]|nr:hypothetical protein [Hyphomicrobiales bacterium]